MFVGRERELASLDRLYDEGKFQMVVMYGRRRVGKTTLISAFISGKPAIFFTAQEANDVYNLRQFSSKVYAYFDLPQSTGAFSNWNDAFAFIAEKAKERRFILAFDEFPYAAAANRSLKSILQAAVDHGFKDTGLFLILCGSHVGFMESEVLGYKSPLFGRRTAQMKLEGFDYYDAGRMLGGFSDEDKLKFYACVGGTPHYLAQIRAHESFEENLKRIIDNLSRSESFMSVMMVDIDFFKRYNDTYGHNEGDKCLKIVAETLAKTIPRADDFVARYGGEEFAVVLPNTGDSGACVVAERLLDCIRNCNIRHEKSEAAPYVTISIGVTASKVNHKQDPECYIKRADEMLYVSKHSGRNMYTFGAM